MKIVIATENKDKLREIKNILHSESVRGLDWMGNYPDLVGVEETGKTLRENASLKANYISKKLGVWAVADDSGLFVEALNGAPGVYSSRFAGSSATYDDNISKLLKELGDVERFKRKAEFRCVVCLARNGLPDIFTEGVVEGYITTKRIGSNGFGYDPVFEVKGIGRTFAEMSQKEKNRISHRYQAFKKMGEIISREVA